MTTSDAADRLVDRLTVMFGEPKTNDPASYMEEFAKAVKGYSAEILEQAGDEVIKTCTFWPRPAEIVQKAEQIAAQIAVRNRKPVFKEEWPEPTPEQKQRAHELVTNAIRTMPNAGPIGGDPVELPPVDRTAFEKMQRESKNEFHRALTDRSRAMSGDRE